MLHSLFFSGEMFVRVASFLPDDLRIICPDHRGQGGSKSGRFPPSVDRLAEDMIQLIDALDGGPVHLVGSSMGGYVALAVALRRPDILKTCTLSCCTAHAEREPERFAALETALRERGAGALVDQIVGTMFGEPFVRDGDRSELERWRAAFGSLDDRIADAVHGVFSRPSFEHELPHLKPPLLLFSGAWDRAKRPADMQVIADRVAGSRHIVLEGAGHTPPVETPIPFAEELQAFWRETTATPREAPVHSASSPTN
jgi:3-oxoadipate enol-lactonase